MYVIKHICKETGFGLTGQIVPFQLFLIVLKDFCPWNPQWEKTNKQKNPSNYLHPELSL